MNLWFVSDFNGHNHRGHLVLSNAMHLVKHFVFSMQGKFLIIIIISLLLLFMGINLRIIYF